MIASVKFEFGNSCVNANSVVTIVDVIDPRRWRVIQFAYRRTKLTLIMFIDWHASNSPFQPRSPARVARIRGYGDYVYH